MLSSSSQRLSVRKLVITGVLGAVTAVIGLTPSLGFIPVGPTRATIMHIPVIIGAIIEGPLVGVMVGLIFGLFSVLQAVMNPTPVSFVFLNPLVSIIPRMVIGVTSYYSYVLLNKLGRKTSKIILALVWTSTFVFLVNTLINQIDGYNAQNISIWRVAFTLLLVVLTIGIGYFSYKRLKDQAVEVVITAAVGTLTNTICVLSMIYFLYAEQFVEKLGLDTASAGKIIMGIGITNGIPEVIIAMLIVTSIVMAIKKQLR